MNDISKQYKITLNTKGTNTLSSDQLLFNHGDDVTIKISIVEDNVNKDISQSKVDLLVLYESDSDPTIHRFEDGGISINDNEVTVVCKNSYVDRIGVSVCQLIIRDEDQSITTQMFSYKTGSTLVSNDTINSLDEGKQWLSQNPTTVYYKLNEPVITKHNNNMNLKTYDGTTHITSDNYLLPTITCKVPSNVQVTIMNLKEENEFLNNTVSLMSLENEEVKIVNETQDVLVNTTMLATDEMYMMLEPLLSEVAQTLSLEREVSKMVDLYVAMVMRGLKTIEQVPARYREQVKEILAQLEK